MSRLKSARKGQQLRVREMVIPYSLWPARKTKRWKVQRRLYVRDPWAMLNEAVYRTKGCRGQQRDEALAYIVQAEDYFNAAMRGDRPAVKPVLLYYSMLNIGKCLLKIRRPLLDMSHARHGLSIRHRTGWGILGDEISVKGSGKYVNVFEELMRELENSGPKFTRLAVRELLPQIVPGHRLWTYACQKKEKFLRVGISSFVNPGRRRIWLRLKFSRGEVLNTVSSIQDLIRHSHLPGKWRQVTRNGSEDYVILEQKRTGRYDHRPIDVVQGLYQQLRPALWYTVTASKPHRVYYVFIDTALGRKRLPQWASVYVLFYYLSDLTRYRPHLFDRLIAIKYGPLIENILDECPRQFLYLMASELLQRDVAPAGIVV